MYNHLPRKDTGMAPIEVLSGEKLDESIIRSAKTWGCPAYVLDPKVQDGKKLPRWEPKARRGQFLGRSRRHASNIGLIRNLRTGSVTTQFHVVYDNHFTTILSLVRNDDVVPENWVDLITYQRERVIENDDVDDNTKLNEEWLNQRERELRQTQRQRNIGQGLGPPLVRQEPVEQPEPNTEPPVVEVANEEEDPVPIPDVLDDDDEEEETDNGVDPENENNRPQRTRVPNPRYYGPDFVNLLQDFGLPHPEDVFLVSRELGTNSNSTTDQFDLIEDYWTDEDGLLGDIHPFAFAA